MALPVIPLPRSEVEVNGVMVPFRSLSRKEAIALSALNGDTEEQDILILMGGTDTSYEDVQAFRESTQVKEVGRLTDAILVFSGLSEGDKDPKPDTSEPS